MSPILLSSAANLEAVSWWTVAYLVLALFLVFLNGFFVAVEFAIVRVRPTRMDQLAREGDLRARISRPVVRHLNASLSACQFGITIASLGLGWLGEPAFAALLRPAIEWGAGLVGQTASATFVHSVAIVLGFTIISALHIILGELAPKALAIIRAEPTALWTAPFLRVFILGTWPLVWALNEAGNASLRLFGLDVREYKEDEHGQAHSERELIQLVDLSAREGLILPSERKFVERVFKFHERLAREVMVPRPDMNCLYLEDPYAETVHAVEENGHTRYPVMEARDAERIGGLAHMKDVLLEEKAEEPSLENVLRPVPYVPETAPLGRLLPRFQKGRSHMGIVVDEYGGISGLITLEDVLEEIVGPIADEFDALEEEPSPERDAEGARVVPGHTPLDAAGKDLGLDVSEVHADTVAGYVLQVLGRIPAPGEVFRVDGYRVEVLEMDDHRIESLRFTPVEPRSPRATQAGSAPDDVAEEEEDDPGATGADNPSSSPA